MLAISIESIVQSYQQLSDPSQEARQQANLYLYSLIDRPQVWKISEEMITGQNRQDYQLLGSQLLYQKVERDVSDFSTTHLNELKEFLLRQLANQHLSLPIIRKLAASLALVAAVLATDHWQSCLCDIVRFMETSPLQLRNGLALLERIPEELRENNHLKHGPKMQVRDLLLSQAGLLNQIYSSAILLEQPILISLALQGLESWILIGFPLMIYTELLQMIIKLLGVPGQLYLQSCCKILKQTLAYAARQKFQSISQSEFDIQKEKYSPDEMASLGAVVNYLRDSRPGMFRLIELSNNSDQIEIYSSIIKELLLSYGFLLRETVGYELIEMLFKALEANDLKLSYSTFEFWTEFCDRIEKLKVEAELQNRFCQIVEHLLDVLLAKTTLDNDTLFHEMLKDDDTIDDLTKISLTQYRKQAQNIIRFTFDYFTSKRAREGSLLFFKKLLTVFNKYKTEGEPARGLELSIYGVKSGLESMVRDYDTRNVVEFIQFVLRQVEALTDPPLRVVAEVLNLLKDCSRQTKQTQGLFLRCLGYCLRYVADQTVGHYAVYAFQSLMQSISQLSNDVLVKDLMAFYSSAVILKQSILQKVLQGILTSVAKLTNRQAITHYLTIIAQSIEDKQVRFEENNTSNKYISLVQIKTLLDSFDHFKPTDQEHFRLIFLRISTYGLTLTTRIIHQHITQHLKFTTVGEIGPSLSLIRNALKICENVSVTDIPVNHYIQLLNVVLSVVDSQRPQFFHQYNGLLDVVCKVLGQFVGQKIGAIDVWVAEASKRINIFFLNQVSQATLQTIDPDLLKWYFGLQESILVYSPTLYLRQPQHPQIYELALTALQFINQRALQRRTVNYLFQCVQMREIYSNRTENTIKTIFASIPNISNICHINLGRILIITLQKTDLKGKESIFRQLLQYEPYQQVPNDLKQIIARLIAFAVESKVQRYIKGAICDLTDIKWKDAGNDLALHLQLRFASWRKEYNKMVKSGIEPK